MKIAVLLLAAGGRQYLRYTTAAISFLCILVAGCVTSAPPLGEPSSESMQLKNGYAARLLRLQAQGRMRTDDGADIPVSIAKLAEDFERIVFFDEHIMRNGRLIASRTEQPLRRWQMPIRYRVIHGALSDANTIAYDRAAVGRFASRLARLTGLSIEPAGKQKANFLILFLNIDEQQSIAPRLSKLMHNVDQAARDSVIQSIASSSRSAFCAGYTLSSKAIPDTYTFSVIHIRSEHPPLGRLSCIHEEMAQAMGLANDSPTARPSIFNDDQEFALLTRHDEQLLRMLYDSRLKPGMHADEAHSILKTIAREYSSISSSPQN